MIELPAFVSVLDAALGIADADRIEASAKVLTVNPINKSRFMKPFPRVLVRLTMLSPLGSFRWWNASTSFDFAG